MAYLNGKYGSALANEYEYFKLDVKFPFLITDDYKKYNLWQKWYPEANQYILSNNRLSLRSRMLQLLAAKKCFWLIAAYYKLVYKFIHGTMYH